MSVPVELKSSSEKLAHSSSDKNNSTDKIPVTQLPDLLSPLPLRFFDNRNKQETLPYKEILGLMAKILVLTEATSSKDTLNTKRGNQNEQMDLKEPARKSAKPSVTSKPLIATQEKEISVLCEIHNVISTGEHLTEAQQNESVQKIQDIYSKATISKTNVDLSEAFSHHPPLLITAAHKFNLAAMKWLLDNGAHFSSENELVFLFSFPELYSEFKAMTEERRRKNDDFVSFCLQRQVELLDEDYTEKQQRLIREDSAAKQLIADIEKQLKTVRDTVLNKYREFMKATFEKPELLKQYKLSPKALQSTLMYISKLSIVDTIGTFSDFIAKIGKPSSFIYAYYVAIARKGAIKIELDKLIKTLPDALQKEVNHVLKFEKVCFEMVLKKIKTYLSQNFSVEMQDFEHYIPSEVRQLFEDPNNRGKLNKHLTEINRNYLNDIFTLDIPKAKKKLDGIIEQSLIDYPDAQLKAKKNVEKAFSDLMTIITQQLEIERIQMSSISYFYGVGHIKNSLNLLVDSVLCRYKAIQDGLLKFKPSKMEMQKTILEMDKVSYHPGIPTLPERDSTDVTVKPAASSEETTRNVIVDNKVSAEIEAQRAKKLQVEKQQILENEKKQVLKAYQNNLNFTEREIFKQILTLKDDLPKELEMSILKIIDKLGLKNLTSFTISVSVAKTPKIQTNFGLIIQHFRATLNTLNITEPEVFMIDLALLKQNFLKSRVSSEKKQSVSLTAQLSLR